MRILIAVLAIAALAVPAAGQDFTWSGWFGPPESNPAWGHSWSPGANLYANGWGHQWYYWLDPAPYFPGVNSWVLIPDGMVLDIEGGQPATCGNLTIAPNAQLLIPYSTLSIYGPTLQNDGLVQLSDYAGNYGTMDVNGPLDVVGHGEIDLAAGRFISWSAVPMVMTVGAQQDIHGGGSFGFTPYGNYHGVDLTNRGHIQASNPLVALDILGMSVVNTGVIEATGGATLRLWGDWDNTGGELLASDGGVVWGAPDANHPLRIEGGTLRTSGGGEFQPESYGSVKNVTLEGTLHIRRYCEVHMSDTITNNGIINQGAEGGVGGATIKVDSTLTLAGDGILTMGDGNVIHMHDWPARYARVTNGPAHTIDCIGGQFGSTPDYYGDRRIELINEGVIRFHDATYGARLYVAGEGMTNRGTLTLAPAAGVNAMLWGNFRQTDGLFDCDDGFIVNDGTFTFTGGILAGDGYLEGATSVAATTVQPGGEGEIGVFDIVGPLTFDDGATLACEWSLAGKDRLDVHGPFTAKGQDTVRVAYLDLEPARTVDYVVLTCTEYDDQADWILELPAGWSSSGLAWNGTQLVIRDLTGMPTAVEDAPAAPALYGATPNPFNPSTTVRFAVDRAGPVRLLLADLAGRRVRLLIDEMRQAGTHAVVWNGCDDFGRRVGSGTYVCLLEASGRRHTIRLTLVR